MSSIDLGSYGREIGKTPLLCAEQERDLGQRIKNGDETAVETMVEGNLRLVVYMAKKYVGRGLDFADLVQEGNEGLVIAVRRFDPDRGVRFSTYACWWIRHRIVRAIEDTSRTVRLPSHLNAVFWKMAAAGSKWQTAYNDNGVDGVKGAAIAGAGLRPLSINDEDGGWSERLVDGGRGPLEICEEKRMRGWMRKCLAALPDQERDAVMRWAGMTPGDRPNYKHRQQGLRRLRRMAGEW